MDIRTQHRSPQTKPELKAPVAQPTAPLPEQPSGGLRWLFIGIGATVALAAVICASVYMVHRLTGSEAQIKNDHYQAVFLSNNQVYFGHLKNIDGKYVSMTDVYYLQVQGSSQAQDQKDKADQSQQASLSKLGTEAHAPEDEMHIARDQILFWENLKDDGKVVQAIKGYQKNNNK